MASRWRKHAVGANSKRGEGSEWPERESIAGNERIGSFRMSVVCMAQEPGPAQGCALEAIPIPKGSGNRSI